MKTSSGAVAQKMISTTVYPGGRNHLTDAKERAVGGLTLQSGYSSLPLMEVSGTELRFGG